MTNDSEVIGDLVAEYHHSVKKYDDWNGKSFAEMAQILIDELSELLVAIEKDDLMGDHGIYMEAVQVANCGIKIARQARTRGTLF